MNTYLENFSLFSNGVSLYLGEKSCIIFEICKRPNQKDRKEQASGKTTSNNQSRVQPK
jgi:hypothetical protein